MSELVKQLVEEHSKVVEEIATGYVPPTRFFEYVRHDIRDLEAYRNKLVELIAKKS